MNLEVLRERETLLEARGHRLTVRLVVTRRGRYRALALCSCGSGSGRCSTPIGPAEWFRKHATPLDSAGARTVRSPRRRRTEAVP